MPEGRVQVVEHHTPELLWQARWLAHANGASALLASIVCVADVNEAASRFARFAGTTARREKDVTIIESSAHGRVLILDSMAAKSLLGVAAPSLPWIAGTLLRVDDLHATARYLQQAGCAATAIAGGSALVTIAAPTLGGVFVFTDQEGLAL
jgi:hypothetical protein